MITKPMESIRTSLIRRRIYTLQDDELLMLQLFREYTPLLVYGRNRCIDRLLDKRLIRYEPKESIYSRPNTVQFNVTHEIYKHLADEFVYRRFGGPDKVDISKLYPCVHDVMKTNSSVRFSVNRKMRENQIARRRY